MFIFGYQTGYNRVAEDTCSIFDGIDYTQILAAIDNYCHETPLEIFATALLNFTDEVYDNRLQTCR